MTTFEMSYHLEIYTKISAKKVITVEIYFKIICMEVVYEGKIKHDWLGSGKC